MTTIGSWASALAMGHAVVDRPIVAQVYDRQNRLSNTIEIMQRPFSGFFFTELTLSTSGK